MKKIMIVLTDAEYEFLKDLQYELRTQTNDGNADPVYWGVAEDCDVLAREGDGDPYLTTDDGLITLQEAVRLIESEVEDDDGLEEKWFEINKTDADDVSYFIREVLKWDFHEVVWLKKEMRISQETGAFLTKRACERYIKGNAYHHDNPRTYAMTAWRNPEFEQFMDIFKEINF